MNALPIPSSSATSDLPDSAWRAAKSPITFALFSAAVRSDSASATGSWVGAGAVSGAARVLAVDDMALAFEGVEARTDYPTGGANRIVPSASTRRSSLAARQR